MTTINWGSINFDSKDLRFVKDIGIYTIYETDFFVYRYVVVCSGKIMYYNTKYKCIREARKWNRIVELFSKG